MSTDNETSQLALVDSSRQPNHLASKMDLSSIENNNTTNREQNSAGDDSVSESANEDPGSAINMISVSSHSELVDLNGLFLVYIPILSLSLPHRILI